MRTQEFTITGMRLPGRRLLPLALALTCCLVLLLHPLLHGGGAGPSGQAECALCALLQGLPLPVSGVLLALVLGAIAGLAIPAVPRLPRVGLAVASSRAPPGR